MRSQRSFLIVAFSPCTQIRPHDSNLSPLRCEQQRPTASAGFDAQGHLQSCCTSRPPFMGPHEFVLMTSLSVITRVSIVIHWEEAASCFGWTSCNIPAVCVEIRRHLLSTLVMHAYSEPGYRS